MAEPVPTIDLDRLSAGVISGVTRAWGANAAEAAAVSLQGNGHAPGVSMTLQQASDDSRVVMWSDLSANAQASHGDPDAAVEYGAYGIAILLAEQLTPYKTVERARKGEGNDYWLGHGEEYPFQRAARLEVSGIRNGVARVAERVQQKRKQVSAGQGAMPAYIAIVEFGQPLTVFKST